MKTEAPGVDWLLNCEPRPAQIEALARSYTGLAYRNHKDEPWPAEPFHSMPHAGKPADGWGHMLEMRVGKTPTLLNEYLLFRRDHGIRKAFVLSPNKYKQAWALEAERFGVDVPVHIFESGDKGRKAYRAFVTKHPEEAMVFVNYEALTLDDQVEMFADFVDDRTFMGADESVLIKNRESGFFKAALALGKEAAITRPMSGKPTPQGVQDLYAQLRFARKLEGWNFFQFRNTFALMGGFKGRAVVGVKNLERLERLRLNTLFFARRADWGTSIEPDYEQVKIDMLPRQRQAYQEMEEDFITWLDSGEAVSADQVITKHIKLQQISSGFILDEDRVVQMLVPFEKTPKFLDLADRLENYITGKTIIVCHYVATADLLQKALARFNPAVIRGSTHMKRLGLDVEEEKRRLNYDPACRVMIAQSKAVKYGHMLMGTPADPCLTTIFFENSYSLDDRSQTEQRNQGEGQVAAINLVDYYSSPVEQAVITALQRKEEVASKIMGYYKGEPVLV